MANHTLDSKLEKFREWYNANRENKKTIRDIAKAIEGGSIDSYRVHPLHLVGDVVGGLAAIVSIEGCAIGPEITYSAGAPRMASDYGDRLGFYQGIYGYERTRGPHSGIDVDVSMGHPVLAAADGDVIFSDWDCCGNGYTVTIEHGKDRDGNYIRTVYMHNDSNLVSVGQKVKRGQRIASSGVSGELSGDKPHLHFGVFIGKTPKRWDKTWRHVDPHEYWFGLDNKKLEADKNIKTIVIPCFDPKTHYSSEGFTYPVECKR